MPFGDRKPSILRILSPPACLLRRLLPEEHVLVMAHRPLLLLPLFLLPGVHRLRRLLLRLLAAPLLGFAWGLGHLRALGPRSGAETMRVVAVQSELRELLEEGRPLPAHLGPVHRASDQP